MLKRILLAGLLGGLVLFLWEGVAHMALPLGEAGFRVVPNEAAFLGTIKDHFKDDGLYIFPGPELRPGMTSAEKSKAMEAAMAKATTGPAGLLVVHPNGEEALSARQFVTQIVADILVMIVAAWVLSKAVMLPGFFARVMLVTALALFPILQVHVPYWNWYGFPLSYIAAQSVTHLIGFFAAGLVLAKLIIGVPK
jgi:hypothetical protein